MQKCEFKPVVIVSSFQIASDRMGVCASLLLEKRSSRKVKKYNSGMKISKNELVLRRNFMVPEDHKNRPWCYHYFNKRNGDGVYICGRDAVTRCNDCWQGENDNPKGRPLCSLHKKCEWC